MIRENPSMPKETEGLEKILIDLKEEGIVGAVIRNDGLLLSSTLSLSKSGASAVSSFSNVCDALLKTLSNTSREIEVSVGGMYFVIVPVGNYLMCGMLKDREQKKLLRAVSEKLKTVI